MVDFNIGPSSSIILLHNIQNISLANFNIRSDSSIMPPSHCSICCLGLIPQSTPLITIQIISLANFKIGFGSSINPPFHYLIYCLGLFQHRVWFLNKYPHHQSLTWVLIVSSMIHMTYIRPKTSIEFMWIYNIPPTIMILLGFWHFL